MNFGNLKGKEKEIINQKNQKDIINNIKSKYIMQKIFLNLEKKAVLNVVKYNKNIKNIINININDYKEYSGKYSSIEIEIIPAYNKYGPFINIKEEEIYYHIYFNNYQEEIKRNCIMKDEKVNRIKVIIDYQIKLFKNLFVCCDCILYLNFKKFHRTNINNMEYMFCRC